MKNEIYVIYMIVRRSKSSAGLAQLGERQTEVNFGHFI